MPFKNYVTEEELKAYLPELSRLLWSDEADYSGQKTEAEKTVLTDLVNRGYSPAMLMSFLALRNSGNVISENETGASAEDKSGIRSRFVWEINTFSSADEKTLLLEGSYNETEWKLIESVNLSGTGIFSKVVTTPFKYYRVKALITGGSLDYSAALTETTYDRLISSKWLELILLDRYTAEDDQYYLRMKYFKNEYERLWDNIRIWSDENEDGEINSRESSRTTTVQMLK